MSGVEIFVIIFTTLVGAFSWFLKTRISHLEELSNRMSILETKWEILGDISTTINKMKTDIEIIKHRVEQEK